MPLKVPIKRKKIDEHSHALVTPPQSPAMQDNVSLFFKDTYLARTNIYL